MTVFARYKLNDEVLHGIVVGENIERISGTPLKHFDKTGQTDQLSQVKLLAPTSPGKIVAIGKNYITHLHGRQAPSIPEAFYKTTTSLIGPGDSIVIPPDADNVEERPPSPDYNPGSPDYRPTDSFSDEWLEKFNEEENVPKV